MIFKIYTVPHQFMPFYLKTAIVFYKDLCTTMTSHCNHFWNVMLRSQNVLFAPVLGPSFLLFSLPRMLFLLLLVQGLFIVYSKRHWLRTFVLSINNPVLFPTMKENLSLSVYLFISLPECKLQMAWILYILITAAVPVSSRMLF